MKNERRKTKNIVFSIFLYRFLDCSLSFSRFLHCVRGGASEYWTPRLQSFLEGRFFRAYRYYRFFRYYRFYHIYHFYRFYRFYHIYHGVLDQFSGPKRTRVAGGLPLSHGEAKRKTRRSMVVFFSFLVFVQK